MILFKLFLIKKYRLISRPLIVGTTIWSPLASGLLTGKYNNAIPDGSRASTQGYGWLAKVISDWQADGKIDKVSQYLRRVVIGI